MKQYTVRIAFIAVFLAVLDTGSMSFAEKSATQHTLVVFANARSDAVGIHWVDAEGRHRDYDKIQPVGQWHQSTYGGHAWLITNEQGRPLGHFVADKKPSLGIIPKE